MRITAGGSNGVEQFATAGLACIAGAKKPESLCMEGATNNIATQHTHAPSDASRGGVTCGGAVLSIRITNPDVLIHRYITNDASSNAHCQQTENRKHSAPCPGINTLYIQYNRGCNYMQHTCYAGRRSSSFRAFQIGMHALAIGNETHSHLT